MPTIPTTVVGLFFYPALVLSLLWEQSFAAITNDRYSLQVENGGSLEISSQGRSARFLPRFSILVSDINPAMKMVKDKETAFIVPSWHASGSSIVTTDIFQAAKVVSVHARVARSGDLHPLTILLVKKVRFDHRPYEFSLPLPREDTGFRFYVEGVRRDGPTVRSDQVDLRH